MIDKFFLATKAVIENDKKLLLLREADTNPDGTQLGKWGLPGGRLELGETVEQALQRELKEETGITEFTLGVPLTTGEWRPVVRGEHWQIIAIFFHVQTTTDMITVSQEHDAYVWATKEEIKSMNIMPDEKAAIQAWSAQCK